MDAEKGIKRTRALLEGAGMKYAVVTAEDRVPNGMEPPDHATDSTES